MKTYICSEAYGPDEEIAARTPDEAAQKYVDGGDWGDSSSTVVIDVLVTEAIPGGDAIEHGYVRVEIDPPEPACCQPGKKHNWRDGRVRGNGAGVICVERCRRCGMHRTTNTAATAYDGTKFESISYSGQEW